MDEAEFQEALPLALAGAKRIVGNLSRMLYWEDIRQHVAMRLWASGSTKHAGTKGRNAAVDWVRSVAGQSGRNPKPVLIPAGDAQNIERLAGGSQDPDESGLKAIEVLNAMCALEPRDASILYQWALCERRMIDIAEDLGVDESRVSQLANRALRRLSQRRKAAQVASKSARATSPWPQSAPRNPQSPLG